MNPTTSATSRKAIQIDVNARNLLSKSGVWVKSENFYGEKEGREAVLLIGFDTEFKPPEEVLTRKDIKDGRGTYKVLSYQLYCKLIDPAAPESLEWGTISYPEPDQRLEFHELLSCALREAVAKNPNVKIPRKVYLVGHFTRADLPAIADFKQLTPFLTAARNTFITGVHLPVEVAVGNQSFSLEMHLRDTMLLTPAASKSLQALGQLVGVPKVKLDDDPEKEQFYKANMDVLLAEKPALFECYAMTDAIICVRYIEMLLAQCEEILGRRHVPPTLTSIGVDLLIREWGGRVGDWHALLGMEEVTEKGFDKRTNRPFRKCTIVPFKQVDYHLALANEAYHGGRNEQFWFGPAFEDDWTDYDLSGAYPTAMALIRTPDWRRIYVTDDVTKFTERTLGVADVDFEFPETVRFPTMPVRTENGLIFPSRGTTACGAPEIALALRLGASIKINHGVIVPDADDQAVFGNFISDCVRRRNEHPKATLQNLFWKELSNSTYGKTAQGLRKKRVYDLQSQGTKQLEPSRITNAFFAAFITSFVRAVLGEIMNSLPAETCVFSCTTDGFLTNATYTDIKSASQGVLASLYREGRESLVGSPQLLETKHECRQPLGWRTRGQATLIEGDTTEGDDHNIVLAKGGIYTPSHLDNVRLMNEYIVNRFLGRTPEDIIDLTVMTGVRDIMEFDADLVSKQLTRRLNMEFDWKRRPYAVGMAPVGHVAFSTVPWESVAEFQAVRGYWEELRNDDDPFCMKSLTDYDRFARHVLSKTSLNAGDRRYLKRNEPDIKRLRQCLGSAWRNSEAGLVWRQGGISNGEFAEILTLAGVPARRADVENDGKKPFKPHRCPPTPLVRAALARLRQSFPALDVDCILSISDEMIDLTGAPSQACAMIARL